MRPMRPIMRPFRPKARVNCAAVQLASLVLRGIMPLCSVRLHRRMQSEIGLRYRILTVAPVSLCLACVAFCLWHARMSTTGAV